MMEVKDFLKTRLKSIFLELDNIEIAYEYRVSTATHIVEVKPTEMFYSDKYVDMEISLEEEFGQKFPNEELLFITEDSLTEIRNPDFVYSLKLEFILTDSLENVFNSALLSNNSFRMDEPTINLAA